MSAEQRPCRGLKPWKYGRLAASQAGEESRKAREESLERVQESRQAKRIAELEAEVARLTAERDEALKSESDLEAASFEDAGQLRAEVERLMVALREVNAHAHAAVVQSIETDDQIIIGHLRDIEELSRAALK
ncbi:MAG: hypothetical protein WC683_01740 [bacterium]